MITIRFELADSDEALGSRLVGQDASVPLNAIFEVAPADAAPPRALPASAH